MTSEDFAGRGRNLAFGQDACRDLVQQRLEKVMGGSVDQGDIDIRAFERLRGEQTAEPGADDHDAVPTADADGRAMNVSAASLALIHRAKRTQRHGCWR